MKIQFSASESNIINDIKFYRMIVRAIKSAECHLTYEWIEEAYERNLSIDNGKADSRDWTTIHKKNIDGIHTAELCIFEASAKSFSIGFQTALALQLNKPTLVLTRNDSLRNSFGSGIVSSLLTYKSYNSRTLTNIIHQFIEDNNLQIQDLRFNFVMDREIYNYLRWAAFRGNTTKAEVIRKLIRSRIQEKN